MDIKNKLSKLKLNKRRIIVLIVLAIICLLILIGIINLFKVIFSKEKSIGNLSNLGLVIDDGNVIFYNKYEDGIVKIKGKDEYQITDETAYSMNIVDDTIYYLTLSNANTLDLKSVKTNGDAPTKIKTLSTPISKFYIENGYAYYVTSQEIFGISKLSLETGEEKLITATNVQDFVVQDGMIYYTDNVGFLYSINVDGKELKTLSKEFNVKKIQLLKKWIYFYNDKENCLSKIKIDGSKVKLVTTFITNETYNITNKNIYYFDEVNNQICVTNLKGKKSKPVVSLKSNRTKINIANGILYYLDDSKNESSIYQMYRVKTNGKATNSIEY
ncbi:MAG: DUF5050 domain-containing protein [Clostridia bacterium]|nr:DUF5050 domain-containing protein [Clostridia bacterium]